MIEVAVAVVKLDASYSIMRQVNGGRVCERHDGYMLEAAVAHIEHSQRGQTPQMPIDQKSN